MTQRPILFSTPMVQAILEGRKTQTRRVVKPQPERVNNDTPMLATEFIKKLTQMKAKGLEAIRPGTDGYAFPKCPYGQPGDVLWVRETWQPSASGAYVHFKADIIGEDANKGWKPSVHMPKDACRLFLRITNVRLERLQEISEQDAKSEGAGKWKEFATFPELNKTIEQETHASGFAKLWVSINGKESWNDNPWVWVVEFERMEGRP